MEIPQFVLVAAEFLFMLAVGFLAGKLAHFAIGTVARQIAKRTKTKLDDFILEEIDGPLVAFASFLAIYELSNVMTNLSAFRDMISKYSLSILILLAAYTLSEIFGAFLKWYYVEGRERTRLKDIKVDVSLLPLLRKLSKITIVSIGAMFALSIVGVNVTGFFALASVVGVVLGLASQETLGNIFAGIALQLDRPFLYGEYLKFPTGEVARLMKIGLRSTKLEDLNGNVIVISNSELAKQKITNLSRPTDDYGSSVHVEVPKDLDLGKFEAFLRKEVGRARTEGLKRTGLAVHVDRVGAVSSTLSVSFSISGHPHLARARDFINRKTLEFLRKNKRIA